MQETEAQVRIHTQDPRQRCLTTFGIAQPPGVRKDWNRQQSRSIWPSVVSRCSFHHRIGLLPLFHLDSRLPSERKNLGTKPAGRSTSLERGLRLTLSIIDSFYLIPFICPEHVKMAAFISTSNVRFFVEYFALKSHEMTPQLARAMTRCF